MIHWNNLSPANRLLLWRNFRQNIAKTQTDCMASDVADFFASLPFGARSIDYYEAADWPGPWDILYSGMFCRNTAALMMFYTIRLLDRNTQVEIVRVKDSSDMFLAVKANGLWMNITPGHVLSELPDDTVVQEVFDNKLLKEI